ncbi:MAG: formate dehydrogenase, partial [Candidatus Diapherotrites archaeon]|nr:formate dehydrogenase [Candidatus Diapherotrites archaeon]
MIVRSPCIFCGAGCRLRYVVEDGKIVQVLPDPEDPVSEGKPCIKGLSIHTLRPKRVEEPLVREGEGEFSKISWEYALELIKDRLENTAPEKTGWAGSGEITNEDNYVIQKFAREV